MFSIGHPCTPPSIELRPALSRIQQLYLHCCDLKSQVGYVLAQAAHVLQVSGSTATVAVIVGWDLLVASVGDSEAYLDTGAEVIQVHSHFLAPPCFALHLASSSVTLPTWQQMYRHMQSSIGVFSRNASSMSDTSGVDLPHLTPHVRWYNPGYSIPQLLHLCHISALSA